MQKLFNRLLVPFDFTSKSRYAVEKAIGMALEYNCSIHLLHVVTIAPFSTIVMASGHMTIPFALIDNKQELEFRLEKLSHYIRLQTDNTVEVDYALMNGMWDTAIIDFIHQNKMDVVLVGQKGSGFKKRTMIINPDVIAEKSNVPVITIPPKRRLTRLCSIMIPITDFLPVRKLLYGIYMALNFDTTIKLVGIENRLTKDRVRYYLAKADKLIRDNCNVNVEIETIESRHVADAINQCAIFRSADLIIVNPGTQTKITGFFASLLGNLLQRCSLSPVLTVNAI